MPQESSSEHHPAPGSDHQQLPVHLFVYGTLKLGEPNQHVLLSAGVGARGVDSGPVFVATGRTVDQYPLVIGSRANIPFLLNRPGLGRRILGHVVCVRTPEALARLDEFEECPDLYRRLPVAVQLLGAMPAPTDGRRAHLDCPLGDLTVAAAVEQTVTCQTYVYCGSDELLLALPHLDDYRSDGSHGLPYLAEQDDIRTPEQVGPPG